MKHLNIGGYHVVANLSRIERAEFFNLLEEDIKSKEERLKNASK